MIIKGSNPMSAPYGRGNQGPMRPPTGPSMRPPTGPPMRPPTGPSMGPPMGPPPGNIPQKPFMARGATRAVDPGAIRNCIGRFTYVWLDNGNEFWMFPLQVGRQSVAGFRWTHRFGWSYIGVSLNRIDFFTCV